MHQIQLSDVLQLDADPRVLVRANVEDVRPYYRGVLISAAPLRSGGGTRKKILESMALGIPVVSKSVGCEGLDVSNRENILIANQPKHFADGVVELDNSTTLWRKISQNGRALVEQKYDWDCIANDLQNIYEQPVH